jgi:hypothetical protein
MSLQNYTVGAHRHLELIRAAEVPPQKLMHLSDRFHHTEHGAGTAANR